MPACGQKVLVLLITHHRCVLLHDIHAGIVIDSVHRINYRLKILPGDVMTIGYFQSFNSIVRRLEFACYLDVVIGIDKDIKIIA